MHQFQSLSRETFQQEIFLEAQFIIFLKMLQVKRWAKQYLSLSPIFQSKAFHLPNNQKIMRINPRLLAPYCLKMLKKSLYDKDKITKIMQKDIQDTKCYWNNYVLSMIEPQSYFQKASLNQLLLERLQSQKEAQLASKIVKFRTLISKTFHELITRKEFTQLCGFYLALLEEDAITQMDNFVIDLSFFRLYQLLMFAEMRYQASLNAIGGQSLALFQKFVNNSKPGHYFCIITILQRLKPKLTNYHKLHVLSQWLSPQADYKQILQRNSNLKAFLVDQSIVFITWLIHIHELGQFLYKYVKQNYLLSEYIQESLKIISRILSILDFDQSLPKSYLLLLNEVISKTLQLQAEKEVFEQFQKNMQLQKILKKLKNKISSIIEKDLSFMLRNQGPISKNVLQCQFIEHINSFQVNFYSATSKKYLKVHLQQICGHPYASLLIPPEKINCLVSLCYKIGNFDLPKKLILNLKTKQQYLLSLSFVQYLENMNQIGSKIKPEMTIRNICQLKRLSQVLQNKQRLQKIQSHSNLSTQQLSSLQILHLLLLKPNELTKSDEEIRAVKSFFTKFDL